MREGKETPQVQPRGLGKGVRVYVGNQRLNYNLKVGAAEVNRMLADGWVLRGYGSESGALAYHFGLNRMRYPPVKRLAVLWRIEWPMNRFFPKETAA